MSRIHRQTRRRASHPPRPIHQPPFSNLRYLRILIKSVQFFAPYDVVKNCTDFHFFPILSLIPFILYSLSLIPFFFCFSFFHHSIQVMQLRRHPARSSSGKKMEGREVAVRQEAIGIPECPAHDEQMLFHSLNSRQCLPV